MENTKSKVTQWYKDNYNSLSDQKREFIDLSLNKCSNAKIISEITGIIQIAFVCNELTNVLTFNYDRRRN